MPKVRNEKKAAESTEAAKAVPIKEQSAKIKKGSKLNSKKILTKTEDIISGSKSSNQLLELGLLCDCTGSMDAWIERARQTL